MEARNCPTCLAPARTGGRPGCRCEQAAAPDFDPLHIRPYVTLPDAPDPDDPPDPPRAPRPFTVRAYAPPAFPPPSYVRVPRPPHAPPDTAVPPPPAPAGPAVPEPYAPPHAAGPYAAPPPSAGPPPYAPQAGEPAPEALPRALSVRRDGLPVAGPVAFMDPPAGPAAPAEAGAPAGRAEPARRRRPLLAGLVVTAAAGSVCAALFGGELRSGHEADRALAGRGDLPAAGLADDADAARDRPDAPAAASRSAVRPPGGRASASAAETPFTRPPGAPTTYAAGQAGEELRRLSGPRTGADVLSEGARGPEVTELQRRLAQLDLYAGPADGRYDDGVTAAVARYQRTYGETGDPPGVYGPATRTSLEFLTTGH